MTDVTVGPRTAVARLPLQPPLRVAPEATLTAVARCMREADTSAVLVGQDGDAIVTERDLVRALAAGLPADAPVGSVSMHHPVAVSVHATVVEAAATMLERTVRHLVVVDDDGEVAGMVSIRAALAVLLNAADHAAWVVELRDELEVAPEIWLG